MLDAPAAPDSVEKSSVTARETTSLGGASSPGQKRSQPKSSNLLGRLVWGIGLGFGMGIGATAGAEVASQWQLERKPPMSAPDSERTEAGPASAASAASAAREPDGRQWVSGQQPIPVLPQTLPPQPPSAAALVPHARADISSRERIGRVAFRSTVFIQAGSEYGAGVVVSENGHVLTCRHVVDGAREVTLVTADGTRRVARVVDEDVELDLALLMANDPEHVLQPARLGTVTSLSMAEEVYGVGAPRKMAFSLARGIVSYVARPFQGTYYLQTDIPTNGGSSGGPVVNARGEVVAISSFILRGTQGLSFALPIDYALQRFAPVLGSAYPPSEFREWLGRWAQAESEARLP